MMHGWGYGGYGGWMGWLGPFFMIAFWVLVALGIALLVRALIRSGHTEARNDTPLEILKKRYARGEIDKAEYEEKLKDLRTL